MVKNKSSESSKLTYKRSSKGIGAIKTNLHKAFENSAFGSSLDKCDEARGKESYRDLEAKLEELQNDNSLLHRDITRHANYCVKLCKENKLILDELKLILAPDILENLKAKNPNQGEVSSDSDNDSESEDSQRTESINEHNSCDDHDADEN